MTDVLTSAERAELSELGSVGAMFSQLQPHYDAWNEHQQEPYEDLRGPDWEHDPRNSWVEVDDMHDPDQDIRDMEVFSDVDIIRRTVKVEKYPRKEYRGVALAFYFEAIDTVRKLIYEAKNMNGLYFLADTCDALDKVMVDYFGWWVVTNTAYDRLEKEFTKAEAKIKAPAMYRAHLIEIGVIKPRREVSALVQG